MDSELLVDAHIEDGRKLIARLARDGFDVTVAFWGQSRDEGLWHLYVASTSVTAAKLATAYQSLYACLQTLPDVRLQLSDVKLLEVSNLLARHIIRIRDQRRDARAAWCTGSELLDTQLERAWIYPELRILAPQPYPLGKRRLSAAVKQTLRAKRFAEPFTTEERTLRDQLEATGLTREAAESWVIQRREEERGLPEIPPGTVVDAEIAAWWGQDPTGDPNPVIRVKAPDGMEGLTLLSRTEPADVAAAPALSPA